MFWTVDSRFCKSKRRKESDEVLEARVAKEQMEERDCSSTYLLRNVSKRGSRQRTARFRNSQGARESDEASEARVAKEQMEMVGCSSVCQRVHTLKSGKRSVQEPMKDGT